MSLVSGTFIAHYQIVQRVGAGGMGEVYRARDTKLGRDVALKILPETVAADPERLARFQREAMTLASLNHPHIAHIYGIEESGPTRALIMELVEGDDLSQRLGRRAIPLSDALPIARQIAEALAAAHQAGIVHRDLKPANIKVRPDGAVKVLDFGLAKQAAGFLGSDGASSLDVLTITSPAVTHAGVILGTAAYMAPEQAKGLAVDGRADIWAYGCVLFEMLVGRPAFAGDTVTEILASVLAREPEWKVLPADTPDSIRRLLRRCLQKDPKRRLHDIADACLELDDAAEEPSAVATYRGPAWWMLGVSALVIAALAAALVWIATRPESMRPVLTPQRLTDMTGLEETPALSPDARSVTFTAGVNGRRHVFVQLLEGGAPLQITHDDADHQFPRWTAASGSIVYFSPARPGDSQGTLWEIPALGGTPRRVAASIGAGDVRSSDGRVAFFRLVANKIQLVTAPLDGSSITTVAQFEPTEYCQHPRWSPDGRWIAYQRGQSLQWEVFIAPAGGGEPRQLTHEQREINGLTWLPDSTGILYSSTRGDSMLYLPTSRLWQVTLRDATVRQVTSGEASYVQPDIAPTGAVVVSRVRLHSDIWKFPADGLPQVNTRTAVRVTHQTSHVLTPTAGPGDREVAFLSDRGGHANIWVIDVGSGALRQLTYEREPNVTVGVPVWSPASDAIAFVSSRGPQGPDLGIWVVNRDGSNLRALVRVGVAPSWSPDGLALYYTPKNSGIVSRIAAEGGTPTLVRAESVRNVAGSAGRTLYFVVERPLVDGLREFEIRAASPETGPSRLLARVSPSRLPSWQVFNPSLSPDGKWIAQALTDGFSTNVWALSTSTGEWRQITDFGGRPTFIVRRVSWSSDGRSILAAVAEGDADVVLLDGLLKTARQ